MALFYYFLLMCAFAKISFQRSTPQDKEYIAAAVEYIVSNDVEQNLRNYVHYIKQAADQNADIIVFPELTLTNKTTSFVVPFYGILKEYPVPALHPDLYDRILVSISAAARNNGIYVVINGRESLDCRNNDTGEPCPELKEYVFNTNVVFDRNGAIIDRYRKINLFAEWSHTPALTPDLGYFETDFGVKFAHFICFDLMFQVPAVQSVQKLRVTDVIFSTMWFSELPYLTAIQIQEAFAYKMNVNFIAAGANNVRIGSAGSGIYSGRDGALISIMPGVPTSRLLVARVPKIPGKVTGNYTGPIYDDAKSDILHFNYDQLLASRVNKPFVAGFQEFTLNDKDVSYVFRVRLNYKDGGVHPRFRAFIQDAPNTYSNREMGVAACLVVACLNDELKSCGHRYNVDENNVIIEELAIEMTTYRNTYNKTLECDNIVYFPVSFRNNKFPLEPSNYTFIEDHERHEVTNKTQTLVRTKLVFKLNKPQENLVSFGIWGRLFLKDVDHNKNTSEEDLKNFDNVLNVIYGENSHDDETIESDKYKYETVN